jgi:uncharacterized membrane protein
MRFKWLIRWRGMEIPVATIIAFAVCAFWSLGMVLAPLSLPPDSVTDLSGKVGTMENTEIIEDMNPYARFFYDAGDSQCHTIKERSLFVNGNQMPFCTRDAGLFFGMALGLLITLFIRIELKWWWLIGGLVPIGIDGTVQLVTSYESNNFLRMTTGGLAGIVTTLALGWVLFDISQIADMRYEEPLEGEVGDGPWETEDISAVGVHQGAEIEDDTVKDNVEEET